MSGSDHHSHAAGRLTAVATLAVSAALFLAALFGIASIDPSADAASPAGGPSIHNVAFPKTGGAAEDRRRDCPFKKHDRSRGGEQTTPGVNF